MYLSACSRDVRTTSSTLIKVYFANRIWYKIIEQGDLQIATATILQSKTHSDRLNKELMLLYPFPTSCGPNTYIGHRGLVMGKIVDGLYNGFSPSTVIVPFQSQNYYKGEDFGKILHTDKGSFYLKPTESFY